MSNRIILEVCKQFLRKRDGANRICHVLRHTVGKGFRVENITTQIFGCVCVSSLDHHDFQTFLIDICGALFQLNCPIVRFAGEIFEKPEIVLAWNKQGALLQVGFLVINPNYGYALRRWLVSEMEGLPGLKA